MRGLIWFRGLCGAVVGASPMAMLLVLPSGDQGGRCVEDWYLYAGIFGGFPWFVVFTAALTTLRTSRTRSFAVGVLLGAVALAASFAVGASAGLNPPGVTGTWHCVLD
ncbi:hypothetical protein ACFQY4_00705 [Catellatospora bangladeshensis]|uniref:Uncharacterized protein n=1 Tax=Catellatospora bangladeshensis TaxID=310355 RepID=A0A8J3JIV5_9ACTN|nr:hypothetical protein [Catellatospora bangladeshensis]GIF81247.1 hypothetical protein Cba03nite_25960 [Catellatospora bangladeshensis]